MCFRKLFKSKKNDSKTKQDKKQQEILKKQKDEEAKVQTNIKEVLEEDDADDELITQEDQKILKENKNIKNIYHISQNKNQDSEHYKEWRVRKEGSKKTIKFFRTQKQAIDFANKLIQNNDGQVVVHKVNGRIRKQGW